MVGPVKIVVRHANGTILKGYSQDFSPTAQQFHVRRDAVGGSDPGQRVMIRDLKAIFFVRDFGGNSAYEEHKKFVAGAPLSGRKMEVTFTDGEVLVGTTTGYDAQRAGFFLFPVDARSNNVRIFIVQAVVRKVKFL
ncbi:MAG: hypothetical protein ABI980_15340 [Nitrospirota bacterium]